MQSVAFQLIESTQRCFQCFDWETVLMTHTHNYLKWEYLNLHCLTYYLRQKYSFLCTRKHRNSNFSKQTRAVTECDLIVIALDRNRQVDKHFLSSRGDNFSTKRSLQLNVRSMYNIFTLLIQLKQNCTRSSRYKITGILYTNGHKDRRTDGQTGWFQYTFENIRFQVGIMIYWGYI